MAMVTSLTVLPPNTASTTSRPSTRSPLGENSSIVIRFSMSRRNISNPGGRFNWSRSKGSPNADRTAPITARRVPPPTKSGTIDLSRWRKAASLSRAPSRNRRRATPKVAANPSSPAPSA